MTRKLIIDGNAVYEIDEECMLKNRVDDEERGKEKKDAGSEYMQKRTAGHSLSGTCSPIQHSGRG